MSVLTTTATSHEKGKACDKIAYADLSDAEQTYCDNQIIQTVNEQCFGTQFLDPGSSQSAGRVRYSITGIDYKVSRYLEKQKGTARCLDSHNFSHTTSFLIHKNKFETSLDSNKIFLHFSVFPHCANVLTN